MDCDEEFSLVTETMQSEESLEKINNLITSYKERYEQLVQDQKMEAARRDDLRDMAQQYQQRADRLSRSLREDQLSYAEKIQFEKMRLDDLWQDEKLLMRELEEVEAALKDQDVMNGGLKLQADVFTGVPEKTVVFAGCTGDAADSPVFDVEPHVVYPMAGGTALITFEDREVAKKILDTKVHAVDFDVENACSITVEATPVHLIVPQLVEVVSEVSLQSILISNLPQSEDTKTLLLELEVHFSKRRNGGGEVDYCEILPDSGSVVITFVEENVARGLTDTEYHDVTLQGKKHKVRVTPFLNGHITKLETKMSVCHRTVLLTGIPPIMERETLQDLLEIHFQKSKNGGGEIERIFYNPPGKNTLAVFEGGAMNTIAA